MERRPALMIVAALLFVGAGAARPAGAQDHIGNISGWEDPEEGFARARREGRPILLFFSASW